MNVFPSPKGMEQQQETDIYRRDREYARKREDEQKEEQRYQEWLKGVRLRDSEAEFLLTQ